MNVRDAVDAPRVHHQWLPGHRPDRARRRDRRAAASSCARWATRSPTGGAQGDANSIGVDAGGTAWGANDKRSADGKASVRRRLTSTACPAIGSGRCSASRTTTGTIIPASAGRSGCATEHSSNHLALSRSPAGHPAGLFICTGHDHTDDAIWIFRNSGAHPGGRAGRDQRRSADGRLHERGSARAHAARPGSRRSSAARATRSGRRARRRATACR